MDSTSRAKISELQRKHGLSLNSGKLALKSNDIISLVSGKRYLLLDSSLVVPKSMIILTLSNPMMNNKFYTRTLVSSSSFKEIISLIREGVFLEWEIHFQEELDFYLVIRNQGTADPGNEFYIELAGMSEFFEDTCCVDADCSREELVDYLKQFDLNPHQFVETYGH